MEKRSQDYRDEEELRCAVTKMKRYAGDRFSEEWIGSYLDKGVNGKYFDLKKMFSGYDDNDNESALERLIKMTGLNAVKGVARELQALVL